MSDHIEELKQKTRVPYAQLKKTFDPSAFEFETTEEVPDLSGIIGQERARAAMEFGLHVNKDGYNIYVSGFSGTGKTSFTESIVDEFAKKDRTLYDWCYVYNFTDAHKPKMLKLPAGKGKNLQEDMGTFVQNLKMDIPRAFNEESYQKERASIFRAFQEKRNRILERLNEIAREQGFSLRQSGSGFLTVPIKDGEPFSEEDYRKLEPAQTKEIEEKSAALQEKLVEFINELRHLEKDFKKTIESLENRIALTAAGYHMEELKEKYGNSDQVHTYLDEVQNDILNHLDDFLQEEQENANPLNQLMKQRQEDDPSYKYSVNVIVNNSETNGAPVITADNPTFYNLIGKVEYENKMGMMSTDFTKIKAGYLHEANGGYLIMQAKDILSTPYAWEALKRSLKNKHLLIENIAEQMGLVSTTSLHPDPIPLNVKVILIGSPKIYQLLYYYDEDFRKLFKMKADFDVEMSSNQENTGKLARFIRSHCEEENLRHFDRTAVAKMAEYSTRLSGHQEKLSTSFNQQVEIIYESDTWAQLMGDDLVTAKHIEKAVEEKKYRSSLYEDKLKENINEGTLLIDTAGSVVGQVNGLAVYQTGEYSFGKPSRITASTYVGQHGIVNIERESKMSGNIHNKGVYILGGYLGATFAQEQPLALTAHLAFEQSYGGVDGDSASSTELYALLSSLADVPIDQGIAVTGSINQKGMIQPIGGVNEKIEGFFDVCKNKGLTGKQGVLIPHQNVKKLMLRSDVRDAVQEGSFHIYAIETVEAGIEILTGMPAADRDEAGKFKENTVFKKVTDKLEHFLAKAKRQKSKEEESEE